MEIRRFFITPLLCQPDSCDQHVNKLDPDEWNNHSAYAIDPKIVAQQDCSTHWAVFDTAQCQRDQGDDNQSIEDHRRQNGGLRCLQMHDVQRIENWECTCEHCRNDCEILSNVIGNGKRGQCTPCHQ